ncbi:glycosyltransferase family 4 protein [Cytobacillus purgationiresistens]|uniref:Glycosyltransferase EpsD n=1 Tax=Cytobacillus purgationiresistens TaxID=863449 RepID=A0ABU0AI43_9BACI|nr:glycosyltransferase family 4 protein [Cytobacillus purgationiresistens]MDQ0270924.1 glycosyltransferase EpsD [Cytobacillus purgationiresistens]
MKKKILFCATVDYHFSLFHLPFIKWFKEQGWEVHVAAAGSLKLPYVDYQFHLPIQRSPLKKDNIAAYKKINALIEKYQYDFIDSHTPMGGILGRLAARNRRNKGLKVIYTAHGFHFCNGAPLLNWLVYYPIEKIMAHFTDLLITINHEDYSLAMKHKFKAKEIALIHGVGVNPDRFTPVTKIQKGILREKHHYHRDAFLMFYGAEFNRNKNQSFLIKALAHIKEQQPEARLILAGEGPELNHCKELAESLGIRHMVDFLGFRKDIDLLLQMCDLVVASSLREGLPVNIMEGMAAGLPIVAVPNRGHGELVCSGRNGWIVKNVNEMADKVKLLAADERLCKQLGAESREIILEKYSVNKVLEEKRKLYKKVINEMGGEVQWAVH